MYHAAGSLKPDTGHGVGWRRSHVCRPPGAKASQRHDPCQPLAKKAIKLLTGWCKAKKGSLYRFSGQGTCFANTEQGKAMVIGI